MANLLLVAPTNRFLCWLSAGRERGKRPKDIHDGWWCGVCGDERGQWSTSKGRCRVEDTLELFVGEVLETALAIKGPDNAPACAPPAGDFVVVDFIGYKADGKVFDSSTTQGRKPVAFRMGQGQVIKGWEEVLERVNAGSESSLQRSSFQWSASNGVLPTTPGADAGAVGVGVWRERYKQAQVTGACELQILNFRWPKVSVWRHHKEKTNASSCPVKR
eukprot:scaffold7666_cov382-Pinguiococcus_pyrenoidosus.AAC.1